MLQLLTVCFSSTGIGTRNLAHLKEAMRGPDRGDEAAELAGELDAGGAAAHDHKVEQARALYGGAACAHMCKPSCQHDVTALQQPATHMPATLG